MGEKQMQVRIAMGYYISSVLSVEAFEVILIETGLMIGVQLQSVQR